MTQPAAADWDEPAPLVLSTHGYQPRPGGDVTRLDPRDESTLVTSLHGGGVRIAEYVGPEREEGPAEAAT